MGGGVWPGDLALNRLGPYAIEAKAKVSTHPKTETKPATRRWTGVSPRSAPLTPSKVA